MSSPGSNTSAVLSPHPVLRSTVAERGSGTVLVLAACAVLVTLLGAVSQVSGVIADVHRARSAADLAALAAVAPLLTGAPSDCDTAAGVAELNGARASSCVVLGDGSVLVVVQVSVRGAGAFARVMPAVVSARARSGVSSDPR
ncbi:MAG: Rv3654c family TadE-like protein [Ornithinibacter sp.]